MGQHDRPVSGALEVWFRPHNGSSKARIGDQSQLCPPTQRICTHGLSGSLELRRSSAGTFESFDDVECGRWHDHGSQVHAPVTIRTFEAVSVEDALEQCAPQGPARGAAGAAGANQSMVSLMPSSMKAVPDVVALPCTVPSPAKWP